MPGSISFAEWVLLNLSCFALTMGCLGLEYLVIGCSNSRARLGWWDCAIHALTYFIRCEPLLPIWICSTSLESVAGVFVWVDSAKEWRGRVSLSLLFYDERGCAESKFRWVLFQKPQLAAWEWGLWGFWLSSHGQRPNDGDWCSLLYWLTSFMVMGPWILSTFERICMTLSEQIVFLWGILARGQKSNEELVWTWGKARREGMLELLVCAIGDPFWFWSKRRGKGRLQCCLCVLLATFLACGAKGEARAVCGAVCVCYCQFWSFGRGEES